MLFEQLVRAKDGSKEDMMALVEKFSPMLRKYGHKLDEEDGYQDMSLAFVEIIHRLKLENLTSTHDGALVNYLAHAIKNEYIDHLDRLFRQPAVSFSLDDTDSGDRVPELATELERELFNFSDILNGCAKLTEKEKLILTQVYFWGCTATEIAALLGTSKQNINQIKRRGLEKLRRQMEES